MKDLSAVVSDLSSSDESYYSIFFPAFKGSTYCSFQQLHKQNRLTCSAELLSCFPFDPCTVLLLLLLLKISLLSYPSLMCYILIWYFHCILFFCIVQFMISSWTVHIESTLVVWNVLFKRNLTWFDLYHCNSSHRYRLNNNVIRSERQSKY